MHGHKGFRELLAFTATCPHHTSAPIIAMRGVNTLTGVGRACFSITFIILTVPCDEFTGACRALDCKARSEGACYMQGGRLAWAKRVGACALRCVRVGHRESKGIGVCAFLLCVAVSGRVLSLRCVHFIMHGSNCLLS